MIRHWSLQCSQKTVTWKQLPTPHSHNRKSTDFQLFSPLFRIINDIILGKILESLAIPILLTVPLSFLIKNFYVLSYLLTLPPYLYSNGYHMARMASGRVIIKRNASSTRHSTLLESGQKALKKQHLGSRNL